jgi:hypothetical protein
MRLRSRLEIGKSIGSRPRHGEPNPADWRLDGAVGKLIGDAGEIVEARDGIARSTHPSLHVREKDGDAERSLWRLASTLNLIGIDDSQPDIKGIKHLVMPDSVNILLVHNVGRPDFEGAAEFGIGLTLIGHTHGGQLSLEFLRRGLSFARLETPYVSGRYEKSGSQLYVNRGIGTTVIPIRLGARPEISEAPRSSRNESLSDIDEAPKPENLAGYKDQEQGEEDQIETGELVETCFQEYNTRQDQQQNDRTPVSDDTPKGSEERADPRRLRLR